MKCTLERLLEREREAFDAPRDCHFEALPGLLQDLWAARQALYLFCLTVAKEKLR